MLEKALTGTLERERERLVANCLPAELYHKSTIVNQDVDRGHLIVSDNGLSGNTSRMPL